MKKTIDIIVPCYNEAENIPILFHSIKNIFQNNLKEKYNFFVIFVNDGSHDNSSEIIKKLAVENSQVRYIQFSKNFGHQLAVKAGIDHSTAHATLSMDADMQHPVELLPKLIEKWEEGFEIIGTIREYPSEISKKKSLSSKIFYRFLNRISEIEIKEGTADFRLIDQKVTNIIRQINETDPFLRGIIPWTGFKQTYLTYTAKMRYAGQSKYTLKKMVSLALQGITSFSVKPLYFAVYLGFLFSLLSLLYIPYVVYSIINKSEISGWASLIMTIVFFGGVQLSFLGIIGIYIGKIFKQIKNRPNYIITEKNF